MYFASPILMIGTPALPFSAYAVYLSAWRPLYSPAHGDGEQQDAAGD
jgi:hypothetical protein